MGLFFLSHLTRGQRLEIQAAIFFLLFPMQNYDYSCKNSKFLTLYYYTKTNGHNNHRVIEAKQLRLVFLTKLKCSLP